MHYTAKYTLLAGAILQIGPKRLLNNHKIELSFTRSGDTLLSTLPAPAHVSFIDSNY